MIYIFEKNKINKLICKDISFHLKEKNHHITKFQILYILSLYHITI